jgi:glycerophosphoryl diester phosphodiesterase
MTWTISGTAILLVAALSQNGPGNQVFYQAHRGGLKEVPENTLAAFRHAWACPGAVPEVDIQTASDGAYVCLHDDSPGRTTNAPPELKHRKISSIDSKTIREWDAGAWFDPKFAGEKVPFLAEVLDEMKGRPERQIYLDAKGIDLDALAAIVIEYGLNNQVIYTHEDPKLGEQFKQKVPGARSMTWISGPATLIKSRFQKLADQKFCGLTQLQLHLKTARTKPDIVYALDEAFIRDAAQQAAAAGVQLQLRPFDFTPDALRGLIATGVQWFVTDEPQRFSQTLAEATKP